MGGRYRSAKYELEKDLQTLYPNKHFNSDKEWKEFLLRKKIIGYDDILIALQEKKQLDQVILQIQQKTRNYAKREKKWLS